MTRLHVWHDWTMYEEMCFSDVCELTPAYAHNLLESWRIHMTHTRKVTHLYACDVFIRDMTRLYVTWRMYTWRGSFICDRTMHCVRRDLYTWLIHARWLTHTYMTHSYVIWLLYMWRDSFTCGTTHSRGTWPFIAGDMTCTQSCVLGPCISWDERWGAGVETQKYVRGEIGGWGRIPFNETYAPSLSTIYDGA